MPLAGGADYYRVEGVFHALALKDAGVERKGDILLGLYRALILRWLQKAHRETMLSATYLRE